jgi:hypothetical protein
LEQEDRLKNLKGVLIGAGFVVLVAWAVAMAFSSTIFVLGFPVPEIMVSPSFLAAGCGFSVLYNSLMNGQRDIRGKAGLTISLLHLTVGGSVLFTGVYVMLFKTPNFFASLCLIIGTALAFLNVKRIIIK